MGVCRWEYIRVAVKHVRSVIPRCPCSLPVCGVCQCKVCYNSRMTDIMDVAFEPLQLYSRQDTAARAGDDTTSVAHGIAVLDDWLEALEQVWTSSRVPAPPYSTEVDVFTVCRGVA